LHENVVASVLILFARWKTPLKVTVMTRLLVAVNEGTEGVVEYVTRSGWSTEQASDTISPALGAFGRVIWIEEEASESEMKIGVDGLMSTKPHESGRFVVSTGDCTEKIPTGERLE
jgi:hypothetical protein